jgi:5-methylcytosine-specific restriction endonuclease McrA
MKRSYSELIQLKSHTERLEYLKLLDNNVTSPRHISGNFYRSKTWKTIRQMVIDRDLGFDLGIFGVYIEGPMLVHHINPIDESDIVYQTKKLLDPENLITVSGNTHNLIHYNKKEKEQWVDRQPGDTKLW